MVKLTIVCHPYTPVSSADIDEWLEAQFDELRSVAPRAVIRLSRLSQELPDTDIETGWLIELELRDEWVHLHDRALSDALSDVFTDMRFLGLQPTLLSPHEFPPAEDPGFLPEPTTVSENGHESREDAEFPPAWRAA